MIGARVMGAGFGLISLGLIGGKYLNHQPTSFGIGATIATILIGAALGGMIGPR